jgi:hypothetical protein
MQYWWVLVTIASSMLAGYLSYRTNLTKETSWPIYLWLINIIPTWSLIARNSTNILYDGMVYDTLLIVTYTATMLFLTNKSYPLNIIQVICIIIVTLALIIFKLAE